MREKTTVWDMKVLNIDCKGLYKVLDNLSY